MRNSFAIVLLAAMTTMGCSSSSGGLPIIGGTVSKKGNGKEEVDLRTKSNAEKPLTEGEVSTGIGEDPDETQEDRDAALRLIDTTGWHPALAGRTASGAPFGYLVCGRSQSVLKNTDYDDFSDIFGVICDKDVPNKTFDAILKQAYTGSSEPQITTNRLKIGDLFVTDYIYSFAVKLPVNSPGDLAGFPIYEEVSKGLKTIDSQLMITKGKDTTFPGKGVVRSLEQHYSMPLAKGAGLYDTRTTLTNTYLLMEGSQDVNLSAEHLLNPDATEYYNATRQIVLGIKGEAPGFSYQVYITQLVVINRFDPERLVKASADLAALIPKAVLRVVK